MTSHAGIIGKNDDESVNVKETRCYKESWDMVQYK